MVVMMQEDGTDPVIRLDESGVELVRNWASPCTEFRVSRQPDGSIVLHPMSAHEADLWRSGLVSTIVAGFSRPDRMIRVKPSNL